MVLHAILHSFAVFCKLLDFFIVLFANICSIFFKTFFAFLLHTLCASLWHFCIFLYTNKLTRDMPAQKIYFQKVCALPFHMCNLSKLFMTMKLAPNKISTKMSFGGWLKTCQAFLYLSRSSVNGSIVELYHLWCPGRQSHLQPILWRLSQLILHLMFGHGTTIISSL